MEKILKLFLIFGGIYLVLDGLVYLFNIRLSSVLLSWPRSAISYATLLNMIYASFVFLAAAFAFYIQRDLKKNKGLILISAIWAFIHGILLIFLSISGNFNQTLLDGQSLHVWIPFYSQYLLFESFLTFLYALLVAFWIRGQK